MRYLTFIASEYALLDSNVRTGGGTDDTAALQQLLDRADDETGVRLVMDGAALVRGLNVGPNTTIECLGAECGFYLASGSNRSIIRNRNANHDALPADRDKNITLLGGTYNVHAFGQEHDIPIPPDEKHIYAAPTQDLDDMDTRKWVFGLEFFGVENVLLRGIIIRNQRTFAMLTSNFERFTAEHLEIIQDEYTQAQNQDGLHFWGPGRYLTLRDIDGTSGDDFIALAPDERDHVSSITDVLIDGVRLRDADQGIRLLSRGTGELDRVLIRNVTGTYHGIGFYINPWFGGRGGAYKNIVFDTVDLRCTFQRYEYAEPMLFKVEGNVENLVLRNIHFHSDIPAIPFILGGKYMSGDKSDENTPNDLCTITIDGFYADRCIHPVDCIDVRSDVQRLTVSGVRVSNTSRGGSLLRFRYGAKIAKLVVRDVAAENLARLYRDREEDSIQSAVEDMISM